MPPILRKLATLLLILTLAGCVASPAWVSLTEIPNLPTTGPATAAPASPTPEATAPPTELPSPVEAESPEPLGGPAPTEAAAGATQPGYLVLLSFDGCRPDYLDLAANTPNLKALLASGTSYSGAWVGALENDTPPTHTMMSTGSFPRHNGLSGYSWANLASGESFNPTTKEAVLKGEMAEVVESTGVPTLAGLIKARYPDGLVAAVSAEKYYAAQALGMGPADFILYAEIDSSQRAHPAAVNERAASPEVMNDPRLSVKLKQPGDHNAYALKMASVLVDTYQPRAVLLNLPDTDYYGHTTGGLKDPDTMRQILETTDQALGELEDSYREAGIFDQTLWVITADHGMTPKEDIVVEDDLFGGLGIESQGADQLALPIIRVVDPSRSQRIAEKIAASSTPGILGAYARLKAGNEYSYQAAPSTEGGLPPALNQAFLYLLSTFAGPYSPDVVVTSSGNTAFDKSTVSPGGSHNMINWADQHILLGLSGPGTAQGKVSDAPARLVDILPTVAQLMGLPTGGMDGAVLADALQSPDPGLRQAQQAINEQLGLLRDALAATGK